MMRARIGLLILGFMLVFAIIGVRLMQLAVFPDGYFIKRNAASDATAAARPDIFDRSGRLIATDVRAPSLFGEPRKIIDADEAIENLGLPGIGFLSENRRVYPSGPEIAHVIGHVNVDNAGIAGLEKWIDGQGLAELRLPRATPPPALSAGAPA